MTSDTLVHSTSTGKGVTATVVNVLVDRGVLSYDTPIAEVWPEFGAHGKQAATVRHALTHSTGVPGVPAGTTPEDLCDGVGMCAGIAAAKPWWEPGNAGGTFSARAIARMYAALMDGLVSDTVLRGITSVAVDGMDEVIGVPVTRSSVIRSK
ncbi:serine hydrolase domain-containing protein [Nonomuraea sp. bgisy101]|uniref:serine hydrolase domain-containing protein n=1 Tax=Nonomuraea sp. bgisy101 TaxID=3413784 RepID=UPI003D710DE8